MVRIFVFILSAILSLTIVAREPPAVDNREATVQIKHPDIPHDITYIGYLEDADGNPVTDTLGMEFKIYNAETGGSVLWSYSCDVSVINGRFSVILTGIPPDVFTGGTERWLEVKIDNETLSPRTKLTSVGWSYVAEQADNADKWDNHDWGDLYPNADQANNADKLDGYDAGNESGQIPISNGTLCNNLNADKLDGYDASDFGDVCDTARFIRYTGNVTSIRISCGGTDAIYIDSCNDGMDINGVTGDGIDIETHHNGIAIEGPGIATTGTGIKIYKFNTGIDIWECGDGIDIETQYKGLDISSGGYALLAESDNESAGMFWTNSSEDYCVEIHGASPSSPGLYVEGQFVQEGGTKSCIIKTSKGKEAMFCIESPEVEFMASGTSKLVNGEAYVKFDRLFKEAISPDIPLKIVVTPKGKWSGLYVVEQSIDGFKVRAEVGAKDVEFDWIAIGRRKGYETRPRIVIPNEGT